MPPGFVLNEQRPCHLREFSCLTLDGTDFSVSQPEQNLLRRFKGHCSSYCQFARAQTYSSVRPRPARTRTQTEASQQRDACRWRVVNCIHQRNDSPSAHVRVAALHPAHGQCCMLKLCGLSSSAQAQSLMQSMRMLVWVRQLFVKHEFMLSPEKTRHEMSTCFAMLLQHAAGAT